MADTEEDDDGGKGKSKKTMIVTLAVVAVLSLVAGGGGWMLGGILAPQVAEPEETAEAASHEEDAKKEGEDEEAKPRENLLQLEPITTNLSYPSENWIRVELSLVFEGDPDIEMADVIQQDIMAYLRTVSLQQIEGPRGFQYLRQDLGERVRLRSKGRVSDILMRTFVIE
ncbi:flagellar basal body-associated FliL family protein [Hoeflea ulvae]|uniref:Flagellar protein FliL n=1 Tax=Hoeflea ulvae TaxID=2983764 RepID=A0ABT3YC99_9HYPH|nr:flagellar basal body-associated FliL family protein [Hoeflea ulvae]MCY0093518.1 flagellar basal body-associated FliL family protein [Hoeflea ulvae]